jgi:pantoate--beta-alanine ligase
MKIFTDIADWRNTRSGQAFGSGADTLGFVATMGALHEGHLSLVRRSLNDNTRTVVSIFINPTQFEQGGDLSDYPRDLEGDLSALKNAGVDAVLLPDAAQIYADSYRYRVSETALSRRFCGAHRPGHFDGVLTVVMRLLNLVQPQRAYFGEKDFQQLQLIRGMVEAFFMDVDIIGCAIRREADGLAMSSRNRRLTAERRRQAAELHRTLQHSSNAGNARQRLENKGFDVDYVEDFNNRRLAAARLGDIRLIDNVPLP